jgi:hypothetical protein
MSSGKVKCTCGWSWNKSDSSKKDMYICHECGRDNSNNMKNGGWLDSYADGGTMQEYQENYNDNSVSLPEGFVGEGYNTKGRDYSPAWGGQFQMGGSIPGAVGFTYARTQSPAPSNGPYAKKTKASAQDGKLIYGSPEYKKAYDENRVAYYDEDSDTYINQELAPIEVAGRAKEKGFWQKYVDKIVEENRGASPLEAAIGVPISAVASLPQMAATYAFTGEAERPSEAMNIENPYLALGADVALDPLNFIGTGVLTKEKALSKLAGVNKIIPSTLKTLPKAKNFKEALGTFKGIPTERSLPRLSPEELRAYRQVQEIGRMRATNKPVSEQYRYALDQNIPDEHFEKVFGRSKSEVEQILPSVTEQEISRSSIPISERFNLERASRRRSSSDAAIDQMNNQLDIRTASPEEIQQFANRVGMSVDEVTRLAQFNLPQQTRDEVIRRALTNYGSDADIERLLERTYTPGELRPIPEELIINTGSNRGRTIINSQNPRLNLKETAIDDWERYVDNKVPTSEVINDKFANIVSEYPYYKGPVLENVPSLSLSTSGNLKNVSKKVGNQSVSGISSGDVFTGSLNTSHNSYLPQIKQVFKYTDGSPQFLGYKPMNHLGFLSDFRYSQDDIAKYLNTEIDQQISRGVIPKDVLRPYVTNKDRVILPHYGIKQFKKGGDIIKDDLGQWAHPGEITEIGSNQITMQGVPYPVLGVSNTGDVQMMYPEEEYEFIGEKVTEFPMAKNGLRQEQKGFVNLDQLTNFTNYNTKQPGGWLDKY